MIYVHPYNPADTRVVTPEADKWFINHVENGDDVLQFELDHNAPYVDELVEETYVQAEGQVYVVKTIEDKSDFIVYTCEIDKDDFKVNLIESYDQPGNWASGVTLEQHLRAVMPYVVNGWGFSGDYADYKDPILLSDNVNEEWPEEAAEPTLAPEPLEYVTPLEILDKLSEKCGCLFNFDTKNKTLIVINPANTKYVQPEVYFTDELNVKAIEYVGTSSDIVTRMYGVGKPEWTETRTVSENVYDPETGRTNVVKHSEAHTYMTVYFDGINDGKKYVEDHSYTDKVISAWYVNEECADAQQLLRETKAALSQACQPKRSYTVQLDNGQMKDADMYDIVWVVDSQRNVRMQHQIIEYKEYPEAHDLDEMTLSQEPVSISKLFKDIQHNFQQQVDGTRYTMQQFYLNEIQRATDMITGSTGGSFIWIMDTDNKLRELVNLGDSDDINKAKQVWRWNEAGLGHSSNGYKGPYDLALLKDGSINASMITTGLLNAVVIRAGILQDINGYNYWNLETGEFRLAAGNTYIGNQTLGNYVDSRIPSSTDSFATASARDVYNKLTNNGTVQGITMSNGNLYINATYVNAGTLGDRYGYNYWNLETGEFRLSANTRVGSSSSSQTLSNYIDNRIPSYTDSFASATPRQIFNKLTNNGAIKGITMSGNNLYINADYINSGTLSGEYIYGGTITSTGDSSVYWKLSSGEFQTHTRATVSGQYHDLYLKYYHAELDFLMDVTTVGRIRMRTGGTTGDPNYHNLSVESYSALWLTHNDTICSVAQGGPGASGGGTLYSGWTGSRYFFYSGSASGSTTRTVTLNRGAVASNNGLITIMSGSSSQNSWSFTC